MAAVTICSDFGAPKNKVCHCFPIYLHEIMGSDAMILVFWMLSFKPTFSLYSFTFFKRLFSYSSLSAIRVVPSEYLRLLIFLPAILIPACASSTGSAQRLASFFIRRGWGLGFKTPCLLLAFSEMKDVHAFQFWLTAWTGGKETIKKKWLKRLSLYGRRIKIGTAPYPLHNKEIKMMNPGYTIDELCGVRKDAEPLLSSFSFLNGGLKNSYLDLWDKMPLFKRD